MKSIAAAVACCTVPWLIVAACTPMSRPPSAAGADPQQHAGATPASEAEEDASMSPMLEQIRVDAAQRAGVPLAEVTLLTVEAVTWSDGSLGCPEPGMMYTQALVPGYRIRVDAAGTALTYHAGTTSTFVHCPPERAQEPSSIDPT